MLTPNTVRIDLFLNSHKMKGQIMTNSQIFMTQKKLLSWTLWEEGREGEGEGERFQTIT